VTESIYDLLALRQKKYEVRTFGDDSQGALGTYEEMCAIKTGRTFSCTTTSLDDFSGRKDDSLTMWRSG
jgi:hypothetical protein